MSTYPNSGHPPPQATTPHASREGRSSDPGIRWLPSPHASTPSPIQPGSIGRARIQPAPGFMGRVGRGAGGGGLRLGGGGAAATGVCSRRPFATPSHRAQRAGQPCASTPPSGGAMIEVSSPVRCPPTHPPLCLASPHTHTPDDWRFVPPPKTENSSFLPPGVWRRRDKTEDLSCIPSIPSGRRERRRLAVTRERDRSETGGERERGGGREGRGDGASP